MLIIINSNVHLPHSNIFTKYLLRATEKVSSCPQVYHTLVRHTKPNTYSCNFHFDECLQEHTESKKLGLFYRFHTYFPKPTHYTH